MIAATVLFKKNNISLSNRISASEGSYTVNMHTFSFLFKIDF